MKTKIGTVIEDDIYKRLKEYSVKENRQISEVIESALLNYFQGGTRSRELRKEAVERLCSKPFNISIEELNNLMEEDIYGQ